MYIYIHTKYYNIYFFLIIMHALLVVLMIPEHEADAAGTGRAIKVRAKVHSKKPPRKYHGCVCCDPPSFFE